MLSVLSAALNDVDLRVPPSRILGMYSSIALYPCPLEDCIVSPMSSLSPKASLTKLSQ